MFVDLVESTKLVSGADPEVVRRRVNTFFERATRCIERHGGLVEKFAGDAVMAASSSATPPEAERFALAARRDVGHDDVWAQAPAREALAHIREAQGRPEQARTLLREARSETSA